MIEIGKTIDTSLHFKVVRDGRQEEVALKDLLKRRAVISVYMRNNTSSCDRQVTSLVEAAAEIDALGFDIIAVSRDTCGSHLKYANKLGVSFTLVSDPSDAFSKAVDAMVEKSMYGKKFIGPARAAYVVDSDGRVLAVIEKVDTADHAGQLRRVLKNL